MSCSLEAEGGRCLTCEAFRAGRAVRAAEVQALREALEAYRLVYGNECVDTSDWTDERYAKKAVDTQRLVEALTKVYGLD